MDGITPIPPTFDARVGKRTSARATSPPGARADGVEGGRAEPRHRGRAARERGENACTCFACASLPRRSHRARERSLRAVPSLRRARSPPARFRPPLPSLTLLAWPPIARPRPSPPTHPPLRPVPSPNLARGLHGRRLRRLVGGPQGARGRRAVWRPRDATSARSLAPSRARRPLRGAVTNRRLSARPGGTRALTFF